MQIPQDQIILVPSQTICQILKRRPHFSGNHEKLEVKKKTSHDAEKIHEVKKHVFEAEKTVRQKKIHVCSGKKLQLALRLLISEA